MLRNAGIYFTGDCKPWFKIDPGVVKKDRQQPPKKVKIPMNEEEPGSDLAGSLEDISSHDDQEFRLRMEKIPMEDHIVQWKHVLYNLLVDSHNNPDNNTAFCRTFTSRKLDEATGAVIERKGFSFNVKENPFKKLAELWALYLKKKDLRTSTLPEVFMADLYKSYTRSCLDLTATYFEKENKWTFLYYEVPLFVPNESPQTAIARLRNLSSKHRK